MRGADTQDPVLVSHRPQHGTEVMVKNVPVKCGQRRLLRQFLGAGFQGKLDRLSDHFMSSGGVGALISKVISISGRAGFPHRIILQSYCKTYLGELTYRRCGAASTYAHAECLNGRAEELVISLLFWLRMLLRPCFSKSYSS